MQDLKERRKFYRIDDGVIFCYRTLHADESPEDLQHLDVTTPGRFTLTSTFAATSDRMQPLLDRIKEQSLEIAECLQLLDRNLALVARASLMQEVRAHEEPTSQVNLGAGGIGFFADAPLPVGTVLEVELILLPSYTGVRAYAKVVYRRHDPGAQAGLPYRVGAEFVLIRDQDRERIARHVEEKGGDVQDEPAGAVEPEAKNA